MTTGAQGDAPTDDVQATPVRAVAEPPEPADDDLTPRLARQPPPLWRRITRIALGVALLIVGIAEVFLPGPAIVCFAIGFSLLAPDVPPIRRAVVALYRRWPKVRRAVPRRFRRTTHRRVDTES